MRIIKSFEVVIPFTQVSGRGWLPLVNVTFIPASGSRFVLPLIFDTGATQITLDPMYEDLFSPSMPAEANAAGSEERSPATRTSSTIEFQGRTLTNRIILFMGLGEPNPLIAGLFGRDSFEGFGFAFWENTREIYVTLNP